MNRYLLILACLLMAGLSCTAHAVIETYDFADETSNERYQQFIEELRCPKCQNQNLAGSNSPISEDLRQQLHRLLEEGRSDQEIVDYMVERYGDFILYRPRFNPETALLWMAPAIFLVLGLLFAIAAYRRQRQPSSEADAAIILNQAEQQRLQALLTAAESEPDAPPSVEPEPGQPATRDNHGS